MEETTTDEQDNNVQSDHSQPGPSGFTPRQFEPDERAAMVNILKSLSGWDGKIRNEPIDNPLLKDLSRRIIPDPPKVSGSGSSTDISSYTKAVKLLMSLGDSINEHSIHIGTDEQLMNDVAAFVMGLLSLGDAKLFSFVASKLFSGCFHISYIIKQLNEKIDEMSTSPGVDSSLLPSVVRVQIKGFLNNTKQNQ